MEKLKVTVLYDATDDEVKGSAQTKAKDRQVWEQVTDVLSKRGHEVMPLPAEPKVRMLVSQLMKDESDLVFNICEGLAGKSRHEGSVASLLELMDKPFTGSGSLALALARDKGMAKKFFHFHGLLYPRFTTMDLGQVEWSDDLQFPLFVKPLNEDASIGIDRGALVSSVKELMERISFVQSELKSPCLIEEYIEGREIYVGVLGDENPEALPLVEWDFSKIPAGTPHFATSEAKWDEKSELFKAPSVFPKDIPDTVYRQMQEAAVTAFKVLKLRDYGRVDMRLRSPQDPHQKADPKAWQFFIIEVNPNPFLDHKAELAMAAAESGLKYPEFLEQIMQTAMTRSVVRKPAASSAA